ncbi:MAG: hypothetical protein WC050_03850 [Candidatus Paceibacterota bacterium]
MKSLLNGLAAVSSGPDAADPEVLETIASIVELPDKAVASMVRTWVADHLIKFGGEKYEDVVGRLKR